MILFEKSEGVLKEMQQGFVNQVDQEKSPFWKILEAKADKVKGRAFKFSAQVEEPQGAGSRPDTSLPDASSGEYIEVTTKPTRFYGVLEFDSMMLEAAEQSADGMKSFVNHVEQELKGLKNTFNKHMSRQAMGTKKGYVAVCGVTANALIVQLAATTMMRNFAKNMRIDLVTNAGATEGQAIAAGLKRTITAVDVANKRITLDAAGGAVTTDDTVSVTHNKAYNAEMTGLADIVSATRDIYSIVTATYPRWAAYVQDDSNAPVALSIAKIAEVALNAQISSGKWTDVIVSSPKRMQQIWKLLTGTTNFDYANAQTPAQKLGFGYYKISVMVEGQTMEWISEVNCPDDRIYGIRKEDLGLQHLNPPKFIEMGGAKLLPNIMGTGGTATFKAVMQYYPELCCYSRNSHWLWNGVTDPA